MVAGFGGGRLLKDSGSIFEPVGTKSNLLDGTNSSENQEK